MAQAVNINAEAREGAGKGAARAVRRSGRVPAVIYGNKLPPVMISLDPLELKQRMRGTGFFARVFEVKVNGDAHRVLARDIQLDPVTDRPLHVDFMRFSATTKLNVDIQVVFINEVESPGLKAGGVINVVRRTVELLCSPENIPESITVDLAGLDIGDSVHISSIELPEGVEPTIKDRDFTVVTIAAPTLMPTVEEEAEGEEDVEGEEGVEGEKGEGEEKSESED